MAGFSDYAEQNILKFYFNNTGMGTAPANLYISLHSADPGDTGANEVTNVNCPAYVRVAVATATGWTAPTANGTKYEVKNVSGVTSPTSTAAWIGVAYWGAWDALTAGNFICGGTITDGVGTPVTITLSGANQRITFDANQIVVSLD